MIVPVTLLSVMSDVRMWPSHWPLLMSWSLVVTHQPCWLSLRSVLASAECYICRLSESQWPMSRCQTVECYPSVFFPGPKESAGRVLRDWWETAERQLKDNCLRQGRDSWEVHRRTEWHPELLVRAKNLWNISFSNSERRDDVKTHLVRPPGCQR